MNRSNKYIVEDMIENIFVWFFIIGAGALLAIIPISLFIGQAAATVCIIVWVAIWGVSLLILLVWPYLRWLTKIVLDIIKSL